MSGLRNRASPVTSAFGVTGTSKEAGLPQPRQVGEREMRNRALTTLVEAVHNAPADVGSIPTVSTSVFIRLIQAEAAAMGGYGQRDVADGASGQRVSRHGGRGHRCRYV